MDWKGISGLRQRTSLLLHSGINVSCSKPLVVSSHYPWFPWNFCDTMRLTGQIVLRFWWLMPKGEKIQSLVCGSFYFVVLSVFFWIIFVFGHCCGLYFTIVWNKTVGLLFKGIWWSSGHHLLFYQFVMTTLLWSKNNVFLEIVMCITTPVMTLLHPSDDCI